MKLAHWRYYNFGIIRGFFNYASTTYSLIINPCFSLDRSHKSRIEIEGRLILGYPRWGSKMKKFAHAGQLSMLDNSLLKIQGLVEIAPGVSILLKPGASLTIGQNTSFAGDSVIVLSSQSKIGSECAISWGITILDADLHEITDSNSHVINPPKSINIGNRVWIGHGVSILKGVTIGENSIIAAGAVVTKSFPPNSVVAGVPARRIRENTGFWQLNGIGINREEAPFIRDTL